MEPLDCVIFDITGAGDVKPLESETRDSIVCEVEVVREVDPGFGR